MSGHNGDNPSRKPKAQGGNLIPGAGGGPQPGGGRPPSYLRERLRGTLEERIPILEAISAGVRPIRERCPACGHEPETDETERVTTADMLRAIEITARYGFGPGIPMDEVRSKLKATIHMAEELLDAETGEKFIAGLRRIWLGD